MRIASITTFLVDASPPGGWGGGSYPLEALWLGCETYANDYNPVAVLLLWEQGQRAMLVNVLAGSGFAQSEAFYRVAQAISETLPNESREKKLLNDLLTGRERLREEAGRLTNQARLMGL